MGCKGGTANFCRPVHPLATSCYCVVMKDAQTVAGSGAETAEGGFPARMRPRGGVPYGAVDLGTNNCRLLVAVPEDSGFRVIDSFSRIVRLGQGLQEQGHLSGASIDRTIAALKVCAGKLRRHRVRHLRCVATEACRRAGNSREFLRRVRAATGLELEIITAEEEARLSFLGCAPIIDRREGHALIFDIGGGSTELTWIRIFADGTMRILDTVSLPLGVVTMSERFGAGPVDAAVLAAMEAEARERVGAFFTANGIDKADEAEVQLLGSSGTVTTVAGYYLNLPRYDRSRVDNMLMDRETLLATMDELCSIGLRARERHPCIGRNRADLVVAGCAILRAIVCSGGFRRLRIADRGLREGLLYEMMGQCNMVPGKVSAHG